MILTNPKYYGIAIKNELNRLAPCLEIFKDDAVKAAEISLAMGSLRAIANLLWSSEGAGNAPQSVKEKDYCGDVPSHIKLIGTFQDVKYPQFEGNVIILGPSPIHKWMLPDGVEISRMKLNNIDHRLIIETNRGRYALNNIFEGCSEYTLERVCIDSLDEEARVTLELHMAELYKKMYGKP